MQIGRRRARAAVEDERDRPLRILRLPRIGNVENAGERLALRVAKRKRAGLRAIRDIRSGKVDAAMRDRDGREAVGRNLSAVRFRLRARLARGRLFGRPGLRRMDRVLRERA